MKFTCAISDLEHVFANAETTAALYLAHALPIGEADESARTAPQWVQIFPEGPEMATVDGRNFKLSDPEAFVAAQDVSAAKPILVDFDHLSAFDPENNGDQRAAGWIEELEVRDGQIWAKVAWTIRAEREVAGREWRFLSPEFTAHKNTKEIKSLLAVALVNRPAFEMRALTRAEPLANGDANNMLKEIAKALGLSETASEEDVLAAIQKSNDALETAKASAKTPSTEHYMPRADYDHVLARAEEAERKLAEMASATRDAEVNTLIDEAVKVGKIAPASKAHYVALASASDAGFEEVKKLTETLPPLVKPSGLDHAPVASDGLDEADRELCAQLGISEEDYAKQKAADQR